MTGPGQIDLIGQIRRMMNQSAAETFDPATDSLEAISAAMGIGPGVGQFMFGIVDATQVASTITVITNNLQNIPSDLLEGQFWMQVLLNSSAVGTAPEGEFRHITNFVQGGALQTFTVDAFTANVEAGDFVAIFHESLLPQEIIAEGTLDTSSATVPEDSTRTEALDYFKGMILMTTEGAVRFQPRRIVTSSAAGVFTLDPNNPFTGVPGLVDYVIINGQTPFVPAADAVINRTPSDVIGNKADAAASGVIGATNSLVALLKQAVTQQGLIFFGDVTTFTDLNNFASTDLAGRENDFFRGWYVMCVRDDGGAAAAPQGEYRLITDYTNAGAFEHNAFSAVMAAGDQVQIIHPMLYEILTIRGGPETLESLDAELDAMLDLGDGDVLTLVMDGTEQTLYETTGSAFIYEFLGLWIDWTGLNAGALEDTSIRFYLKVDGANYRLVSTEVFLAAAVPVPAVTMHPRNATTDVVPATQYFKQDLRITAQQGAIGGGWNTLTYNMIDAKRGT